MIRFGFDSKKTLTGADAYVRIMQTAAMLPAAYILIASGYLYVFAVNGLLSLAFDIGITALPRWFVLILSFVYRKTASEVIVFFMMTAGALVFGLILDRLLKGKEEIQKKLRCILIALIAVDLILRIIPLGFAAQFGTAVSIVGATVRIACLGLLLMDLRAE